jgi:hypothetical protein
MGGNTVIPHWSFNAARPEQPEFEIQVVEALKSFYQFPPPQDGHSDTPHDVCYREFPNFWRGFVENPWILQNGSLRISREHSSVGQWRYDVDYSNESSGERQHVRFATADDDLRTIEDEWHVDAYNTTFDSYRQFSAVHTLETVLLHDNHHAQLRVQINGTQLVVPGPRQQAAVVSGYTLVDILPRLVSGVIPESQLDGFLVIEEMQSILGPCRIRSVGTVEFEPAGTLNGICVFGRGFPPSYWWIDEQSNVVIITSTWKTLVASAGTSVFKGRIP